MEAFQATLEELEAADLLVHVADASQTGLLQQIESVEKTLHELGLERIPRILVLNKWDLLGTAQRAALGDMLPDALHVSAATGEGLDNLLSAIERRLLQGAEPVDKDQDHAFDTFPDVTAPIQ